MVKGFHIQDDGTRVPMDYGSDAERAWCEAGELHQHEHFAEAHKKMEEYQALSGGYFSMRDSKFFLKIELGNLRVNLTQQNVDNCVSLWKMVAGDLDDWQDYREMADNAYFIANRYFELRKYPIKFDGQSGREQFEGANAAQSVLAIGWYSRSFVEPIANMDKEDFNEETDFIYPIIDGIKHARDPNTPGSSNPLDKCSIDAIYRRIISHEMYKEYMKNNMTEDSEGED